MLNGLVKLLEKLWRWQLESELEKIFFRPAPSLTGNTPPWLEEYLISRQPLETHPPTLEEIQWLAREGIYFV